jgi:radical SAM PhpK family P-methyltransferase
MPPARRLDCLVIGYNESPFELYESMIHNYGEDSEAYRDLKFSFIDLEGRKVNYVGLMNSAWNAAQGFPAEHEDFISGEIPNLAAVYLTNYLRRRGYGADYLNLFQYQKADLERCLSEEDPHCVAITTTFYVVNFQATEMVQFIRSRNERARIVVGGPLIANHTRNYDGEQLATALADIGADIFVVEGQGETTLAGIVECLRRGGDLASVPNILYFEGGQLHRTAPLAEGNSLDENYIDWSGFAGDHALGRTIQTRTARSCAFKCAFCNYPTRAGALTLASLDTIGKELDSIVAVGGVRNVVFIDDTFNVPLPRFKDICRLMIERDYGLGWFSYFRCSNSDEEAIELMARSGCKGVFLGIESGSPSILVNMSKSATIEKYARGLGLLRAAGILTFGSFIVGFPGETRETVDETLTFIREYKPDYYRAQLWYCEAGTPIERQREKYGIEGDGFVWKHATMDSLEAMDHIDRMFLSIHESEWLPQWSFDFWFIPYLLGKGVSLASFKEFMHGANKALALEIAAVPERQKRALQKQYLQETVQAARQWRVGS